MTFSTPRGTHGARQPSGRVVALFNRLMSRRAGRSGSMMGMQVLALTTVGRRSGQERTTPLARFPGPDGSYLVCASAGGASAHPAWYLNLAAHPDRVRISVDGRTVDVVADELHGPEREAAWEAITSASARFAEYQTKTDRELPVIRLTPVAG